MARNLLQSNTIMDLKKEFDKVLDNFFDSDNSIFIDAINKWQPPSLFTEDIILSPNINFSEDDNKYFIAVELPGVLEKDLEINVEKGLLSIKGKKEKKEEIKNRSYHKIESIYGTFKRSITLPSNIDENKVEAIFRNGMLEITITKSKEASAQRKKIEIKK